MPIFAIKILKIPNKCTVEQYKTAFLEGVYYMWRLLCLLMAAIASAAVGCSGEREIHEIQKIDREEFISVLSKIVVSTREHKDSSPEHAEEILERRGMSREDMEETIRKISASPEGWLELMEDLRDSLAENSSVPHGENSGIIK